MCAEEVQEEQQEINWMGHQQGWVWKGWKEGKNGERVVVMKREWYVNEYISFWLLEP